MLEVHITQVAPSPQGLVLGMTVRHRKAGWVRFTTTVLLLDQLHYHERQFIVQWLNDHPWVPLSDQLDLWRD